MDADGAASPISSASSAAELTVGGQSKPLLPPNYDPASYPPEMRVDAKTPFSSERTFVVWFHLAMTVGLVSFGAGSISNSAPLHFTARLLVLPCAFFAVWPLIQHRRRINALHVRTTDGLQDRVGPLVTVLVMCGVVLLSTANAWRHWLAGVGDEEDFLDDL